MLLGEREFRLLFGAQAVSLLGDGMVRVALAFAVLEAGGSASDVGMVFAIQLVPMVLALMAGGVVADRVSRRAVMVAADLVRVGAQGAIAALLISGSATVGSLAVLAGVTGAATGFFLPAGTGLLPAVVRAADLQRANGLRNTAMAAGEIAGPLLAGVLVATVGAGWALAVDAGTYLISAVLLLALRLTVPARETASSFVDDLREGWRAFRTRRWVWAFVLAASIENMLWGAWTALGAVVAERSLGGAAAWGAILAAMGAGGVIGGLLALRVEPRRPLLVAAAAGGTFAVPLALLAAGSPAAVVAAGALVAGVGLMLGVTVWESTLQRHIPEESLSRVSAYDWLGSIAFKPVGLALWGPVAVLIGTSAALWLAAALLLCSALALVALPEVRRGP